MKILIIVIAILFVIGLYVIATRNGLVSLRNKVKDEWSQIDVQLKRRFDLVPNLVETVKGYAKHEKDTFKDIVDARNMYEKANNPEEEISANAALSSSIGRLFALAENYPELKANQNFLDLQSQLKEVEDKIAYARQFYNDSVLKLNNKIEMFPSNIVANMFHFEKEKFFETAKEEKENVQVKF